MENKKSNIKNILLAILAIAGFVVILLSCMQLRGKGYLYICCNQHGLMKKQI